MIQGFVAADAGGPGSAGRVRDRGWIAGGKGFLERGVEQLLPMLFAIPFGPGLFRGRRRGFTGIADRLPGHAVFSS